VRMTFIHSGFAIKGSANEEAGMTNFPDWVFFGISGFMSGK
jgi:hypothetical protein